MDKIVWLAHTYKHAIEKGGPRWELPRPVYHRKQWETHNFWL